MVNDGKPVFNFKENFKKRKQRLWFFFEYRKESDIFNNIKEKYNNYPSKDELCKYINLTPSDNSIDILTREQALHDLEQLKFLLRWTYSGYFVFGEEKFLKAFDTISGQLLEDGIQVADFAKLIYDNLNFIQDKHFCIKKSGLRFCFGQRIRTFFCDKFDIRKIDNKYYVLDNEKLIQIKKINSSNDLDKYIKVACNEDGELFYCIVLREKTCDIELENMNIEADLKKILLLKTRPKNKMIDVKKKKNYLYIRLRNCKLFFEKNEKLLSKKLKFVEKNAKKRKNVIINSAFNIGGADSVNKLIMEKFKLADCRFINLFHLATGQVKISKDDTNGYISGIEKILKNDRERNGIVKIKVLNEKNLIRCQVATNNLFILQNQSFSAGEVFSYWANCENMVLLGDYTCGAQHFGNIMPKFYLDNSKIGLSFGASFFANIGNEIVENLGYEPDIFLLCKPEKLEKATKNFINKNIKNNV